jgi:RNA polymerase sigma-70 factor (ECF subfamily)
VTRDKFSTTRWTIVLAAGRRSNPETDGALAELCQIYWRPLYGYLRGRGYQAEDAQDLTQGFFARFLERQSIRVADPARGRFRAFILTALKRYVMNEHERATSKRRGGRRLHLALDFEDAERTHALERRSTDTPEQIFNRKWATVTLDRALTRVREECERAGKLSETDALLPYLTDASELPAYKEIAAKLGWSEGAVKIEVLRLRRRLGKSLRVEVGDTVADPEAIDREIRDLLHAVSR